MTKLGQHFLKSKKIIDEIVKAAEIKPTDTILEAGPGKGILTEALVKNARFVMAVEKDARLVKFLEEKLKNYQNLKLVHADILKFNNSDLIQNSKFKIQNFKIVANIPYYISSRFLRNFLSSDNQPELMVLMLQKEVAERIIAKNRKESLLSISVKAYGEPKIIKKVPAKYFSPPPKVDSAILKISNISKSFFRQIYRGETSIDREEKFFGLVRKGFSQKRKMLKNNLGISKNILKKCGLSEKARAEELSLRDWRSLLQYQHKKNGGEE